MKDCKNNIENILERINVDICLDSIDRLLFVFYFLSQNAININSNF